MANLVIPDGGTIGSASDTDALTITNTGVVKASQSIATSTIKDATGTNNSISIATNGEATFADNIILTANKGLSFQNHSVSSATGASSTTSDNVLDDYEEGSWTPVYEAEGGGTAGAGNTGAVYGFYRKIGNLVYVVGAIEGSRNTLSGNIKITGLPFNVNNLSSEAYSGGLTIGRARLFATDMNLQLLLYEGSDEIWLWQNATNTSSVRVTHSNLNTNSNWNEIYFSGCYIPT